MKFMVCGIVSDVFCEPREWARAGMVASARGFAIGKFRNGYSHQESQIGLGAKMDSYAAQFHFDLMDFKIRTLYFQPA
jgi:hypothetical protein